MLRISSPHRLSSFRSLPGHNLEFSPIPVEDDELINAIEAGHEETWQLDPTPDSTALGEFWSGVEDDLHNDPTWETFADDDE